MDIDAVRAQFPVTERYAYFNNAAVAPMCVAARDAMIAHAEAAAAFGTEKYGAWDKRVTAARESAARLINARPDEIAFLKNTTEGICFVAEGLNWRPGDNVVIPEREYPANVYPWLNLADRGVTVRWLPHRDGRVHVDALPEVCDDRTRLVALSHVQFSSGFRTDLAQVGAFCRDRGSLFLVDAIQSVGAFPVDVAAAGVDFLAADGHKWLVGPEGEAIFYCRRDRMDALRLIEVGAGSVVNRRDYLTYDLTLPDHARRFESGSHNLAGLFALGAAIDYLLGIGIDAIAERVLMLTDRLCRGLGDRGWQVLSVREPGVASGIVMFDHPAHDAADVVRLCREHDIIVALRAGAVRASPHFYNSEDEIDRLLDVLPG